MKNYQWLLISFLALATVTNAQTSTNPKITEYFAVYHTIGSYANHCKPSYIFGSNTYKVYLPFGINVFKNPKVGFSIEVMPCFESINTSDSGKSLSKVSEVIFHPGLVFPLKHGFTLTERIAMSTSGRYGVTQVLSKTLYKDKYNSYYAAIPLALRFGNENDGGENLFFWGLTLGTSF